MRRLKMLLPGVLAIVLLCACGKKEAKIRDDVAAADLSTAMEEQIAAREDLVDPGEGYITGAMQLIPAELGEYVIKISADGTNIDEYGVFKSGGEQEAQKLAETLQSYLDLRRKTWMSEYLPEQYPKLENAQVKQLGRYACYVILGEEERSGALDAFTKALEE